MSIDKSGLAVRGMFSDIAWRYDLLNHLLSANQDKLWRRQAVRRLAPAAGERILDLCCGTGDLALEIVHQQPACHVTGADFALPMLQLAAGKASALPFAAADALQLPFGDASFDALTVGFGVRNFEVTQRGIAECYRVLRPGGRLMVLEFMAPRSAALRQFFGLFNTAFAPVGRALSGHNSAYNYLPQSISGFYSREEFAQLLKQQGFEAVSWREHSAGVATSFLAVKPALV